MTEEEAVAHPCVLRWQLVLRGRVEIVTDGLKSKSKWWRKCPLQISHASKNVLHSERSVAIFAEGSAAKEQWYTALKEASGQASSIQRVKESYQQFSDSIRAEAPDLYPQVRPPTTIKLFKGEHGHSLCDSRAEKKLGCPENYASSGLVDLHPAIKELKPRQTAFEAEKCTAFLFSCPPPIALSSGFLPFIPFKQKQDSLTVPIVLQCQ